MVGAASTLFAGRRPRLQRAITLAALGVVAAVCAVLLYLTDRDGTLVLHVGGWGPTEAEAGLAAAARAEPSIRPVDADELLLIGSFLRRPPPELRVLPLAEVRLAA